MPTSNQKKQFMISRCSAKKSSSSGPPLLFMEKRTLFVVTKCYWPARVSGNKPPRATTTIQNRVVPSRKVPSHLPFMGLSNDALFCVSHKDLRRQKLAMKSARLRPKREPFESVMDHPIIRERRRGIRVDG